MPNAIVNGISIDYSTAGDGPPVLLICGAGQPAGMWFAQVTDLTAAGHTVITFDNRGCGRPKRRPRPTW
jgi:haloacetate dehalogenase